MDWGWGSGERVLTVKGRGVGLPRPRRSYGSLCCFAVLGSVNMRPHTLVEGGDAPCFSRSSCRLRGFWYIACYTQQIMSEHAAAASPRAPARLRQGRTSSSRARGRVSQPSDSSRCSVAPLPPVAVQPAPAYSSKNTIVCHMDYTLNLRTDRPQLLCNVWRAERAARYVSEAVEHSRAPLSNSASSRTTRSPKCSLGKMKSRRSAMSSTSWRDEAC